MGNDYWRGLRDGTESMRTYYNMVFNGIMEDIEQLELEARDKKDRKKEDEMHLLWQHLHSIKRELNQFADI